MPTSAWPAILSEKQILLFLWSVANREPYRTTADRFEWNTKFPIIPAIPSKRVHSKRIPKFSKTFSGIFTVHSISDRKSRNFWWNGKRPITGLRKLFDADEEEDEFSGFDFNLPVACVAGV